MSHMSFDLQYAPPRPARPRAGGTHAPIRTRPSARAAAPRWKEGMIELLDQLELLDPIASSDKAKEAMAAQVRSRPRVASRAPRR